MVRIHWTRRVNRAGTGTKAAASLLEKVSTSSSISIELASCPGRPEGNTYFPTRTEHLWPLLVDNVKIEWGRGIGYFGRISHSICFIGIVALVSTQAKMNDIF